MRFLFPACLYFSCTASERRPRFSFECEGNRRTDEDHRSPVLGPLEHFYDSLPESKKQQTNWHVEAFDRWKALAMLLLAGKKPLAGFQLLRPLQQRPAASKSRRSPLAVRYAASAPSRLAGPPRLAQQLSEEERRKRLKQLFGENFRTPQEIDEALSAEIEESLRRKMREAEPEPEWTKPRPDGLQSKREWDGKRLTFWLEDSGVKMDKVNVTCVDERRLELVTATAVPAGTVLFDVPSSLVLTADAAFADPEVGRTLWQYAAQDPGSGFDTFAIATLLGAERVRRGAMSGKLRRKGNSILPKWEEEEAPEIQSNFEFSPLVASLGWPLPEEVRVLPEQAEALKQGAALIAQLIDPVARNAWFTNSVGKAILQPTSTEDVDGTAIQALLLAMEVQVNPPPPLGQVDGEARWAGEVRDGPALCPLVNLVLSPSSGVDAARAAGEFNAILGRPSTEDSGIAMRCVATQDLPAGAVIRSDVPGNGAMPVKRNGALIVRGSRVRVVQGALTGRMGTVVLLRKDNGKPLVRLEGNSTKPVILPVSAVEVLN